MIETYQLVIICFACFAMGVCAGSLLADWSFFYYPGYWIKRLKENKSFWVFRYGGLLDFFKKKRAL